MTGDFSLEQEMEFTKRALKQLLTFQKLIKTTFGSTKEEIRETQKALAGLTPAEIRDACWAYKTKKSGKPLIFPRARALVFYPEEDPA